MLSIPLGTGGLGICQPYFRSYGPSLPVGSGGARAVENLACYSWRVKSCQEPRLGPYSAEAIPTVNGFVTTGFERNRGVLATLGADRRMHLAGCSIGTSSGTSLLALAGAAALGATLGFVGIPPGCE